MQLFYSSLQISYKLNLTKLFSTNCYPKYILTHNIKTMLIKQKYHCLITLKQNNTLLWYKKIRNMVISDSNNSCLTYQNFISK